MNYSECWYQYQVCSHLSSPVQITPTHNVATYTWGPDGLHLQCSGSSFKDSSLRTWQHPSKGNFRSKCFLSMWTLLCRTLKNKAKAPFVGPPKSKKFPKGIKFGMFTNQCGEDKWNDAGLRHHEKACCDNGKYFKCPDE